MKRIIILLTISIFLVHMTSAISTDLSNETRPSETVVLEVLGNIIDPIEKENVKIKRKNVEVPVEYDVKRLGDDWFIWFIAPSNHNNYTLIIEEITTTVNGTVSEIDFEQNFTVLGEKVDYNIKPGFVFAQEDFELEIFSFIDLDLIIDVNFPFERQVTIEPGSQEIEFDISGVDGTQLVDLGIGDYTLPAYIITEELPDPRPVLEITPVRIERTIVITEEKIEYPINIVNTGDVVLEKIEIDYGSEIIVFDPIPSGSLEPGESFETILVIENGLNSDFNGNIVLNYGAYSEEIPIFIEVAEELNGNNPLDGSNDTGTIVGYYCSELSGTICTAGEVCDGENVLSLDGSCCLSSCTEESESSTGAAIGWLIAGVVLLIILIVLARYKKSKGKKVDPLKKRLSKKPRRKP